MPRLVPTAAAVPMQRAPAAAAAPPPAAAAAAAAAAPPPAAAGAASFVPAIAAALAAKEAAPRTTEEHAHVRVVEDKTALNLARAAACAEAKTSIPVDAQTSLDSPVIAKWARELDGGLG